MLRRLPLVLTTLCLALLAFGQHGDAQQRTRTLSQAEQDDLDNVSAQRRADERKSEATRQTARQIGQEIEELRNRIIDISKKQGTSETRAAIYRAKLETLNLQEADITRRLTIMRTKEARLLSALQIYTRNPPPALFISTQRANDAVLAAIIMRQITPELQKRTKVLYDQNAQLVAIRRQAALQNDGMFAAESDVSKQRGEIEDLIRQKMTLEDQLLGQADQLEAQSVELKAREDHLRGAQPLKGLLGLGGDDSRLLPPVVGDKVTDFGNGQRGITYAAQPGAQVTAPAEGEVEFAGPVDSYGQVVILNVGHDFRVVLTGIGRVYVEKGQTVGRHEPVGRMPNLSDKKVSLYMELRRSDTPVNPATSIQVARN
ncbi:murein hydrolase activator EnvC family protein [Asticcacaulis solisilvae]|uniref:murein hydrolase activator EnvC family protein n=1 Tax=Asticcacaulis solisilvae TaxID=1217274 RepID=UPI003FD8D45A